MMKRAHSVKVNCTFSSRHHARSVVAAALLCAGAAWAGEADVVGAKVSRASDGSYNFDVTVKSSDRGWDYYADAFEVLAPDGAILGRRELLHPHETEQPFTRELYGVKIPRGVDRVVIRARHKPKGYDGKTLVVELPKRAL
jgi:hypothetical protein